MFFLHPKLKHTIFSLFIIFFISCSKEEEIVENKMVKEEIIQESIDFTMDGKTYKSVNKGAGILALGTNYNGSILFSNDDANDPLIACLFKYQFDEAGTLMFFELTETKKTTNGEVNKKFKTPKYKPLNSFRITKFEHNRTTNKVIIEFKGTLNSQTNLEEKREVEGKLMHDAWTFPPYGMDYCYMKSSAGTLDLLSSYYQYIRKSNGIENIHYATGDGFNISIETDKPLKDFNNFVFDENSTINRVIFRKALPPFYLDAEDIGMGTYYNNEQLWEEYKTSGYLEVTSVYNGSKPNGGLHLKGTINLTVKDNNNNVLYRLRLEFVTLN